MSAPGSGGADEKSRTLRFSEALDVDLAISLGEAKNTQTGSAPLVPLLKSWTKKSGTSRRLFIEHVLEATLDPLTWRTAHQDVGPRPKVNVLLIVPGGYDAATT